MSYYTETNRQPKQVMNRVLFATLCFVVTVIVTATLLLGDGDKKTGAVALEPADIGARVADEGANSSAASDSDSATEATPADGPRRAGAGSAQDGADVSPQADPTAPNPNAPNEDWGSVAPAEGEGPSILDDLGLAADVPAGPVFDAERGGRRTATGREGFKTDAGLPMAAPTPVPAGAASAMAPADPGPEKSNGTADAVLPGRDAEAVTAAPEAPSPRSQVPRPDVQTAQRLLNALGYDAGPADGLLGPRTRTAVAAYQQSNGYSTNGRVTPTLLADLRGDQAAASRARRSAATGSGASSRAGEEPSILASIVSRFQELTGRDLNSRANPAGLDRYCSDNPSTWVYDAGVGALIYCDRWVKQRRLPTTAENPSLR